MAITHLTGCDLTGKSTLSNKLSQLLECPLKHFDKPKDLKDGKRQYFDFLANTSKDSNIILDRFHDGEHVYAPLYRGYESDYLKEFESHLIKYPYLLVYVYADLDTILDRLAKRGEDYVKHEDFQKILDLFNKYLIKQTMPYIMINTDDSQIEKYMEHILKSINKIQLLYDFRIKNNYINDLYFGNIDAENLVIINEKESIENIKNKFSINYNNYWFTTNNNDAFVEYQISLLKPKNIIKEI